MSKARKIENIVNSDDYDKAVIYCRVSSDRQKNEGHGLDSQEHRCRELARTKGYEVVEVFKDSYSGAGDFMHRPAMAELLAFILAIESSEGFSIFVLQKAIKCQVLWTSI